jgi:hypothetical protein
MPATNQVRDYKRKTGPSWSVSPEGLKRRILKWYDGVQEELNLEDDQGREDRIKRANKLRWNKDEVSGKLFVGKRNERVGF